MARTKIGWRQSSANVPRIAQPAAPRNIAVGQIDIDIGNALAEMAQKMTEGVPQADGSVRVEAVMDPEHVAQSILHMASFPLESNVLFMTVMATKMPFVGRG